MSTSDQNHHPHQQQQLPSSQFADAEDQDQLPSGSQFEDAVIDSSAGVVTADADAASVVENGVETTLNSYEHEHEHHEQDDQSHQHPHHDEQVHYEDTDADADAVALMDFYDASALAPVTVTSQEQDQEQEHRQAQAEQEYGQLMAGTGTDVDVGGVGVGVGVGVGGVEVGVQGDVVEGGMMIPGFDENVSVGVGVGPGEEQNHHVDQHQERLGEEHVHGHVGERDQLHDQNQNQNQTGDDLLLDTHAMQHAAQEEAQERREHEQHESQADVLMLDAHDHDHDHENGEMTLEERAMQAAEMQQEAQDRAEAQVHGHGHVHTAGQEVQEGQVQGDETGEPAAGTIAAAAAAVAEKNQGRKRKAGSLLGPGTTSGGPSSSRKSKTTNASPNATGDSDSGPSRSRRTSTKKSKTLLSSSLAADADTIVPGTGGLTSAQVLSRQNRSRASGRVLPRGNACEFCKRRKLRCDGVRPECNHCQGKEGRECIYSQKKPIPKIKAMQDRLAELELALGLSKADPRDREVLIKERDEQQEAIRREGEDGEEKVEPFTSMPALPIDPSLLGASGTMSIASSVQGQDQDQEQHDPDLDPALLENETAGGGGGSSSVEIGLTQPEADGLDHATGNDGESMEVDEMAELGEIDPNDVGGEEEYVPQGTTTHETENGNVSAGMSVSIGREGESTVRDGELSRETEEVAGTAETTEETTTVTPAPAAEAGEGEGEAGQEPYLMTLANAAEVAGEPSTTSLATTMRATPDLNKTESEDYSSSLAAPNLANYVPFTKPLPVPIEEVTPNDIVSEIEAHFNGIQTLEHSSNGYQILIELYNLFLKKTVMFGYTRSPAALDVQLKTEPTPLPKSLLYAILTASCFLLASVPKLAPRMRHQNLPELARRFLIAAQREIVSAGQTPAARIETIQAYQLVATILLGQSRTFEAWLLAGQGLRLAVACGLHRIELKGQVGIVQTILPSATNVTLTDSGAVDGVDASGNMADRLHEMDDEAMKEMGGEIGADLMAVIGSATSAATVTNNIPAEAAPTAPPVPPTDPTLIERSEKEKQARKFYPKRTIVGPVTSMAELGDRVQVFWSLLFIERVCCLQLGWPTSLANGFITTPWPRPIEEYANNTININDDETIRNFLNPSTVAAGNKSIDSGNILVLKSLLLLEQVWNLFDFPDASDQAESNANANVNPALLGADEKGANDLSIRTQQASHLKSVLAKFVATLPEAYRDAPSVGRYRRAFHSPAVWLHTCLETMNLIFGVYDYIQAIPDHLTETEAATATATETVKSFEEDENLLEIAQKIVKLARTINAPDFPKAASPAYAPLWSITGRFLARVCQHHWNHGRTEEAKKMGEVLKGLTDVVRNLARVWPIGHDLKAKLQMIQKDQDMKPDVEWDRPGLH